MDTDRTHINPSISIHAIVCVSLYSSSRCPSPNQHTKNHVSNPAINQQPPTPPDTAHTTARQAHGQPCGRDATRESETTNPQPSTLL
mmetsp:Transcript_19733/g.56601  ORF Transcript_19733/g.56601 Transcript_19733/m.56601 type:complete len:87 (+) Transcript_19733:659-919(+)